MHLSGPSTIVALTTVLAAACGGSEAGDDPFGGSGMASATGGTEDGGDGDGDTEGDAGTDSDTDTDGTKFDLMPGDVGAGGCDGPDGECEGCTSVDLLFVIDNSGSMGKYQQALALAFPAFTDTLVAALPPGTNVHVGVTSTEMGFSADGNTIFDDGECKFLGDGGQNESGFYDTPDMGNSGKNGAQGRLYQAQGEYYATFDTDDGQDVIDGVKEWFTAAANIGTGGSNIEMLTAPAGWAAHASNEATNAGFIRDAGSVMVVFFMQDEPDQTPMTIAGMAAGTQMLEMLAGSKTECGGVDCIVAGGFLEDDVCGGRPIDDFLGALPEDPQVAPLPPDDDPQKAADAMNAHLSDTLAKVIAKKCDEIPPVG